MTSVERCKVSAILQGWLCIHIRLASNNGRPMGLVRRSRHTSMPIGLLHYLSLFGQRRAGPLSFLCRTNQSYELVPSRQVSPAHFTLRPEVGLWQARCSTAGVLRKDLFLQGWRQRQNSLSTTSCTLTATPTLQSIEPINQPPKRHCLIQAPCILFSRSKQ
jgi:hypothetical protein